MKTNYMMEKIYLDYSFDYYNNQKNKILGFRQNLFLDIEKKIK